MVRGVSLGHYYKQPFGETHQAEMRWNYRPNGLWSTFALGVQKGGYMSRDGGYAVYFNMTWTLDKSQASFRASQYGGQTQLSGDYRRDFQDSYGTTSLGTTVNRQNRETSLSAYGSRSGTRGETSLNLGHNSRSSSADFNYRGMVAASADGLALGRYSSAAAPCCSARRRCPARTTVSTSRAIRWLAAAPMRYRSACTTTCPSRGWSAATTAWT